MSSKKTAKIVAKSEVKSKVTEMPAKKRKRSNGVRDEDEMMQSAMA